MILRVMTGKTTLRKMNETILEMTDTHAEGPPKWIICCNPDGSNLHAEVINNPVEVLEETLYDTEQRVWEATLALAVKDRAAALLAYKKSHHEVERIENTLKSLTTGDIA